MKLRYKFAIGLLAIVTTGITALGLAMSYTAACEPMTKLTEDGNQMHAVLARCYGPPDTLNYAKVTKPSPSSDEILVKVQAASVNPLDWHEMRGAPYILRLMRGLGAPTDPRMGVDFAGTVEAVGKDVTRFEPGDEVFGGAGGAFAEYLTIRENRAVVHKPANMSFEQAATVPIAALTALQALRDKGQLQSGQKVLINGASGGVGTFAVQIAKSMGAEVTGVCSTRNVDMVRSIGADYVFDYKQEDYTESGQRYDLIVDMVGNHSPLANLEVLTPNGALVMVGGQSGNWLGPLLGMLNATLLQPFVDQKMISFIAILKADDLTVLADLMLAGKMTPVIDQRYSLSDIPAAIAYSEEGHVRGKIAVHME
ncbi:MAG: NADPH:quinone reductase-like Zn-dependent oxidoreductase [Candidatus Azotimanducaceae bacterium]|jgi:NADPH:quinone reductase-like Zn-dependent oxidoreductase